MRLVNLLKSSQRHGLGTPYRFSASGWSHVNQETCLMDFLVFSWKFTRSTSVWYSAEILCHWLTWILSGVWSWNLLSQMWNINSNLFIYKLYLEILYTFYIFWMKFWWENMSCGNIIFTSSGALSISLKPQIHCLCAFFNAATSFLHATTFTQSFGFWTRKYSVSASPN